MHSLVNGTVTNEATRYANIFALLYGYVVGAKKDSIIKALKEEIGFYKHLKVPVVYQTTDLMHLRIQSAFTPEEVYQMPRDVIPELLAAKLSDAFAGNINMLPIETEYDERYRIYKAHLDIWVKSKHDVGGVI